MAKTPSTPLGALFSILKKHGHISYKDLAALILSEKPLMGGTSPINRVNDRTWISRYLVHAPVESVKSDYFIDCEKCAMRIVARLKKRMSNQAIMTMIAGVSGREMVTALSHRGQTTRAFASAEEIHGSPMATPRVTPHSTKVRDWDVPERSVILGLLRVMDGYVMGSPHWLDPGENSEIEVGAFATGKDSLSDVAADVSRHHARIWHDGEGEWYVKGTGSTNGTVLVSGADRSETVVEPPADERGGWTGEPVALKPGDELVFGKSTHYVVIAGVR